MMSSDRRFVMNPTNLDRQRSVFPRNYQHKMSLEFGKLNLVSVQEVLPGDTFSVDMASVIRMGTPIAPVMDNIFCDFYAFFVPNRLTWEHWKEFNGESDTAWVSAQSYIEPQISLEQFYDDSTSDIAAIAENYLDQMGVPIQHFFNQGAAVSSGGETSLSITALPLRGIQLIYNEFFRDENNINKVTYLAYDDNDISLDIEGNTGADYSFKTGGSMTDLPGVTTLFKVGKLHDQFTSALRAPQRGSSVTLPMAGYAPVVAERGTHDLYYIDDKNAIGGLILKSSTDDTANRLFGLGGSSTNFADMAYKANYLGSGSGDVNPSNNNIVRKSNQVVDLTVATSATVNQLRYAFATQRYLEALARGGCRYIESLKAIYGVNAPNGLLQRPEYLGGKRIRINVDQVLANAETAQSDGTLVSPIGETGAYSLTNDKSSLYTKSFVEHGYVFIFAVIRQDHTYSQGVNRMFFRKNLLDRYVPQLANIGEVPVFEKEIYCGAKATDDTVFGYQEAWYDYRYMPDYVSGKLNPTNANALDYWTLADDFVSAPTLSQGFIEENNNNLSRALVANLASGAPEFIADFYIKQKVAREMPLYSIPGLIDHH